MTTPTGISARDHAERVAVFRHGIIGALATRDSLSHGDLAEALRRIAEECHRPPEAERTRTFSVATLQRWLYAYKKGGLEALRPSPRSDRGRGRDVPAALRELLLDIRREFPSASVPVILRTLVADGRLQKDAIGEATVRRLFRQAGLARLAQKQEDGGTRETPAPAKSVRIALRGPGTMSTRAQESTLNSLGLLAPSRSTRSGGCSGPSRSRS